MSLEVVYEEQVTLTLARYLDDPDGLSKLMDSIDALADDPRPAEAVAFGPNVCRLYVGHYRVTYDVTATQVRIGHITRVL